MLLGSIFKSVTSSIKSSAASSAAKKKAGDQGYGSYSKAKSSIGAAYPSSKSSWQKTKDDIAMDLGLKPKDAGYYSRLPERSRRSQEANEQMMRSASKDRGPSKPKGPTAAELEAQRKAAALAKRKAEGQKVRKKFEKEKGERRIALRKRYMKLLKLA